MESFIVIEGDAVVFRSHSMAAAFAYRDVDGVGVVAEVLCEAQEKRSIGTTSGKSRTMKNTRENRGDGVRS